MGSTARWPQTVRWTVLKPTKGDREPAAALDRGRRLGVCKRRSEQARCLHRAARLGLHGITAIRLEALPDDRLPSRGPGRVYYEGPFGDFYLSEIRLSAEASPCRIKEATASNPKAQKDAAAAIDGDPQTGWSINGGQGHENSAVFRLSAPIEDAGDITVEMLFERYYAAGLGRFRISATTDQRAVTASEIPFELEPILLTEPGKRKPKTWIG